MRLVELSNHPGDMLDRAARQRLAAHKRALARYQDALIRYRAQVQAMRVRRDRARAGHRWWTWLRLVFGVWASKRHIPRPPIADATADTDTDTEERLRAGIEGERRVATELGAALGEDWTLLRGYRNRRGEIDHLLLGPAGLFAIEVKTVNATVHVDGDRWRADKYDNYGNLVEQRPMQDRKGRSPSEQLNEPAAELERFLHQRGQPVQVRRAVVLTHEKSRLGSTRNLTVQVGASVGYLLGLVRASADRLDETQRAEVGRLILRDHAFHAKGHGGTGGTGGTGRVGGRRRATRPRT